MAHQTKHQNPWTAQLKSVYQSDQATRVQQTYEVVVPKIKKQLKQVTARTPSTPDF